MEIAEVLKSGVNCQLVVNATDLREYSISIIEETLSKKEEQKPEEHYLTTKQTAERLGVDVVTLWRYQKCNYLVPIKVGGKKRYRESDLKKLMEG
jgi:hypothetical protein